MSSQTIYFEYKPVNKDNSQCCANDTSVKHNHIFAETLQELMHDAIQEENPQVVQFLYKIYKKTLSDKECTLHKYQKRVAMYTDRIFYACVEKEFFEICKCVLRDTSRDILDDKRFYSVKPSIQIELVEEFINRPKMSVEQFSGITKTVQANPQQYEHCKPRLIKIFIEHIKSTKKEALDLDQFKYCYEFAKDKIEDNHIISYIFDKDLSKPLFEFLIQEKDHIFKKNVDTLSKLIEILIRDATCCEVSFIGDKFGLTNNRENHIKWIGSAWSKTKDDVFTYLIAKLGCDIDMFNEIVKFPISNPSKMETVLKVVELEDTNSRNHYIKHVIQHSRDHHFSLASQKYLVDISELSDDEVTKCLECLVERFNKYLYGSATQHFIELISEKYADSVQKFIEQDESKKLLDYMIKTKMTYIAKNIHKLHLEPQHYQPILIGYIESKSINSFISLFTSIKTETQQQLASIMFKTACRQDCASISTYLVETHSIGYHTDYDGIFENACKQGYLQIATLLAKLFPHYKLVLKETIGSYKVDKLEFVITLLSLVDTKCSDQKSRYDEFMKRMSIGTCVIGNEECIICKKTHKASKLLLKLECGHWMCARSLLDYYKTKLENCGTCVYCKKKFEWSKCEGYYKIE